jgi:hypothetical protein
MTPKEKAKELFEKFIHQVLDRDGTTAMNDFERKQCLVILVDEMLGLGAMVGSDLSDSFYIYWTEVKEEINNLNN